MYSEQAPAGQRAAWLKQTLIIAITRSTGFMDAPGG